MKDYFSVNSKGYSQFRPRYPEKMIQQIVSLVKEKNVALDVATGNGQVAAKLAAVFQAVYGTDISENQLSQAPEINNVIYRKMPAEQTDFADRQFDLITVAQAIHWFDFDTFYKEIYRILKPDGVFAVMGYGFFSTNKDSDKILWRLYEGIVGPYWDPERDYLTQEYQTIPFPLDEIVNEKYTQTYTWTFEQLIGYLETWSATTNYEKANNNENPIDIVRDELKASWEKGDKKVAFPMFLRIGKLKP
ncbi:methylase involved in ubiquinone/menaquinone biosynthesis [Flavobacterium enshiense DK69]|uniref:SAM-dependent methyltransferase n=1 Tax=Flavobacterium enshiense DK69 TaxID=1107311 RepID=V6S7L6_9FLAO|nr:class I SAM-dependent methyltransferase [Flavobacterium enshiense]ESU22409.1 methylase involved in ubiquinone/menaquinone biosynthesis [Flavobacterium enshiense DK69]KGO97411.1 SAM-dependent methyltransferase [Flavobacterium enshiense DK69]